MSYTWKKKKNVFIIQTIYFPMQDKQLFRADQDNSLGPFPVKMKMRNLVIGNNTWNTEQRTSLIRLSFPFLRKQEEIIIHMEREYKCALMLTSILILEEAFVHGSCPV